MNEANLEDHALLLALLESNPGASAWREIRDCYEAFGCASKLLSGEISSSLAATSQACQVKIRPSSRQILEELEALCELNAQGVRLLTSLSSQYPRNLRSLHHRPPFLYLKGRVPDHKKCVAIVGSRMASPEGLEYSRRLSLDLVRNGYCVVSGLAAGVDAAAHGAALQAGGETIAVLGTGIDRYYPRENAKLQDEIASRGAVLTQFRPGSAVHRHNFPRRNLVTSGTSLATVVVEAYQKSGTESQVKGVLKHGGMVFFTHLTLAKAEWARKMLGLPGVHRIESPEDLYRPLNEILSEADGDGGYEQLALSF